MSIEANTSPKNLSRHSADNFPAFKVSSLWLMTLGLYGLIAIWFSLSDRLSLDLVSFSKIWAVAGILVLWESVARLRLTGNLAPIGANPSGRMIFAQAVLIVPALGILNHLLMSLNFPLADDLLSRWDEWFGFDWPGYANMIGDSYFLTHFTQYTYSLLIIVIIMIALEMIIAKDLARCQELFKLYLHTALTAIVLACFFPSRGAMDRYADAPTRLKFDPDSGTAFIKQLLELRSGDPLVVDPIHLSGLAEFPSFHTAAAVIIVYACRSNLIRMAFGSAFAAGMIAGTPIYGGHYLVDIISGALLAMTFIIVGHRLNATRRSREMALKPAICFKYD